MRTDTQRQIHRVDLDADDGVTFPSFLLAHIAWPFDKARRWELYLSLCANAIRKRCVKDPAWAAAPQRLVPQHAARPDGDIARGLKGFDLRIRNRIAAGRMAVPFLREVWEGKIPPLPGGETRLSANVMAGVIADDVDMTEVSNVTQRVWDASRPVIHLCAALTVTLQEAQKAAKPWLSITDAFADRSFLELILTRGRAYEILLPLSSRKIPATALERFHLVSSKVQK